MTRQVRYNLHTEETIDLVLRNQRLFAKLQDDPGFRRAIKDHIRPRVYERQRAAGE